MRGCVDEDVDVDAFDVTDKFEPTLDSGLGVVADMSDCADRLDPVLDLANPGDCGDMGSPTGRRGVIGEPFCEAGGKGGKGCDSRLFRDTG